jgi:hypothetical protein
VDRLGGKLVQDFAFVSLPTGDTVYVERMTAREDCRAGMVETGIVGVRNENEPTLGDLARGRRVLCFDDGTSRSFESRFGGEDVIESFRPPKYLAIDESVAFLLHASRGVRYVNIHDYPKWRGIEDLLVLNSVGGDHAFRAGQSEAAFVVVTLPNCGIREAAERYRSFSVLEAGPAGCQALICGAFLVTANFASDAACCVARGPASGETRVFRGRTAVSKGLCEWRGEIEARTAGCLPLLYTIRGSCEGMVADVPARGCGTLSNASGRALSLEIESAAGGGCRKVSIEPGRFLELE